MIAPPSPALLLPWLDLAGIAVFAASGALGAARAGQTIVTFAFFAVATGVGGGTVRDLLIDAPVFWLQDSRALGTCLAVALLVWVTPTRIWRPRALDWFDALGLAAYAVYGASKAMAYHIPPLGAAAMGVVTCCMGGIIRDVLAGEPSILLRPEIYVSAAALGSFLFVGLILLGVGATPAALAGAAAAFALRAAAIAFGWRLPAYRG
ncbi:MAG: trimeric intracellular cation channel family protein [Sphingomonas fennica]